MRDVEGRKAYRKIQNIEIQALKGTLKIIENLVEYGKRLAKVKAPYYTGKTSKLIRGIKRRTVDGASGTILAPNPTAHRPNFNLVRWMHATNGVLHNRRHIISGDPRFMFTVTDILNRKKKSTAIGVFKNIKFY